MALSPLKLPLDDKLLKLLQKESQDWAICHGLVMYSKTTGHLTHAPFTLFPTTFPRRSYQHAEKLGIDFNLLVHKIAKDTDFLINSLSSTKGDTFTSKLLEILKTIAQEGNEQVYQDIIS